MNFIATEQLTKVQLHDLKQLAKACLLRDGITPHLYWPILSKARNKISVFLAYHGKHLLGICSLYWFTTHEISCLLADDNPQVLAGLRTLIEKHYSYSELHPLLCSAGPNHPPPFQVARKAHNEYNMLRQKQKEEDLSSSRLMVRKAHSSDITAMATINVSCFDNDFDTSTQHLSHLLTTPSYTLFVALLNKRVIGKIHLCREQDAVIISDFAIAPKYQGQGHGNHLLKVAINHCLSLGISTLKLDVETRNENALRLYQSLGFVIESSLDYWWIDTL